MVQYIGADKAAAVHEITLRHDDVAVFGLGCTALVFSSLPFGAWSKLTR